MTKDKIKILKNARKIMDEHLKKKWTTEDEHTAQTILTIQGLNNLGFNSISEFGDWNYKCNFEEYKRCNPIDGSCDGCAGLPSKVCFDVYGEKNACGVTTPQMATDIIYKVARKRKAEKIITGTKTTLICPHGHGFYLDETKRINPDFDIEWKF